MLNLQFKTQNELMKAYLPFVHDGALTTVTTEKPTLGDIIDVNLTLPENKTHQSFTGNIILTRKRLDGTFKIGIQLTDKINQLIFPSLNT